MICNEHVHDVDQYVVQKDRSGCPLQHVKVSDFDTNCWNRQELPVQNFPFLCSPAPFSTERSLDVMELIRHLEAVFIYQYVHHSSVHEYDIVHHAEEWVVLKVSNRGVATDDAHADRQQLESEYYIFIDGVEQCDIELEVAQILVGSPPSEDSNGGAI